MGYSFPLQCALFWHILFIYFSVGSVALQTYWHSEWCWIIQEAKRWSHLLCFFIYVFYFFSQEDYNRLLTKYAEAENTIDRLRLEAKVGFTDCVYGFMLFSLRLKVDVNSVPYSPSYQQACLLSAYALMSTRAIFRLLRLSQHNINAESLCDRHNHSPQFSSTTVFKHKLIFRLSALSDCYAVPQMKGLQTTNHFREALANKLRQ